MSTNSAFVDPTQRQVCWAHLVRDFSRISQRDGMPGRIGHALLGPAYLLFRYRKQSRPAQAYARLQKRVRRALRQRSQSVCPRTQATCDNLLQLWPALWTFVTHPEVEPTNNDAERAIRPLMLKRKISGLTRCKQGDEFIARAYSVAETCRRQGLDLLALRSRSTPGDRRSCWWAVTRVVRTNEGSTSD